VCLCLCACVCVRVWPVSGCESVWAGVFASVSACVSVSGQVSVSI
jgi:hypothetical protein